MQAVAKVGMMQPPPEHKWLRIRRRDVPRRLLEAIAGFIGVLTRQRGLAAQPGVRRQWIRIDIRPDVADDGPVITCILINEGGGRAPRHDTLPDHVEKHGAIVVVAPVHWRIEELADLQLYAIAHLQRTV